MEGELSDSSQAETEEARGAAGWLGETRGQLENKIFSRFGHSG